MKLQGKKIAIFLEDLYEDLEYWYPYYRMKEEGAEVMSIGPAVIKDEYKGKKGTTAKAERSIHDVRPEDFDALIIPGGYSPDYMRRVPAMVDFTRAIYEQKKVVAFICHAGWMAASADIVRGKKVTGVVAIKVDMVNAGATWEDAEVVRDGNLISSRNPDDLPAFCRAIIDAIK